MIFKYFFYYFTNYYYNNNYFFLNRETLIKSRNIKISIRNNSLRYGKMLSLLSLMNDHFAKKKKKKKEGLFMKISNFFSKFKQILINF